MLIVGFRKTDKKVTGGNFSENIGKLQLEELQQWERL
jgi:hypothetical protein